MRVSAFLLRASSCPFVGNPLLHSPPETILPTKGHEGTLRRKAERSSIPKLNQNAFQNASFRFSSSCLFVPLRGQSASSSPREKILPTKGHEGTRSRKFRRNDQKTNGLEEPMLSNQARFTIDFNASCFSSCIVVSLSGQFPNLNARIQSKHESLPVESTMIAKVDEQSHLHSGAVQVV